MASIISVGFVARAEYIKEKLSAQYFLSAASSSHSIEARITVFLSTINHILESHTNFSNMKYLQLASVAAALSGSAMAFTVSLWNGPMCTSAEEGQYDISVAHAGSGCHTNGAGVAQSATIQMGDGGKYGPHSPKMMLSHPPADGSGDTIAFYTSDDCNPENAFAEGDSGCIDVTGDSQGAYGSFNAVGSGNEGRVKTRSANETAESEHPLKVEHGQVKYAFGGTYKWHQVCLSHPSKVNGPLTVQRLRMTHGRGSH